ncbi:MAG TPA: holo-ACP synthase, partial [Gemmatimonadales bacterium]
RVTEMLDRKGQRALKRLLTDAEQAYCLAQPLPAQHVAARLAAKEAVYKALQIDPAARAVGWREIEVVRSDDGAPSVTLHGKAREAAERLKVAATLISISHTQTSAGAIVILLA